MCMDKSLYAFRDLIIDRTFECLIDSYVVVALWVIVCVLATTVG